MDPVDETLERDNSVQTVDDDIDLATTPTRTSTNSPTSSVGSIPNFTNPNQLNRLVVKPSGNMIKLRCTSNGNPEPTIQWTKDGKSIERKMGQVQVGKWAITLEDLIPDDSGLYVCKICNIHGCINHTTKIEVEGKYQTDFY